MSFLKSAVSAMTGYGLEQPVYDVTTKTEGYEERQYGETHWVSTTVEAMLYKEASSICFWRLFQYISGQNASKTKIPMTAPVTVRVLAGQGPNCESTFTQSFYLSKDFHSNPPKPDTPEVETVTQPPFTAYVRTFGGFADEQTYIQHARELADSLPEGTRYRQDYFMTAGYDSPFKLFNRRNEVWLIKEREAMPE